MPLEPATGIPYQQIDRLVGQVPTPFYIYDEDLIRTNARRLHSAFTWCPSFREYFAVKANPNPHIVRILAEEGCGADCSSVAELHLAEKLGLSGDGIFFSSNNTQPTEFQFAMGLKAIINLDHPDLIPRLLAVGVPVAAALRFCPEEGGGNAIIGTSADSKFGCTRPQIFEGVRQLQRAGVKNIGLHTMAVSNELRLEAFDQTARTMFNLALQIQRELNYRCAFINLGGGIGIPYRPGEKGLSFEDLSRAIRRAYEDTIAKTPLHPMPLFMENGRVMTGPFGWLVTRVISVKNSHKRFVGVDASMANLMRPGMYGAYHHITVLGKVEAPTTITADVVGPLCENNDKFAVDRALPEAAIGDTLVIHDAGAHGHAMGFQYNGRLRCAEYLLATDGTARLIRRAETLDDYFATIDWNSIT